MAKKSGRTSESEIAIAALRIAAASPNGLADTTKLKQEIPDHVTLTAGDLAKSQTRPGEKMFEQIVGNIISHRDTPGNIIHDGYAEYTGDGIRITDLGRKRLEKLDA